MSFRRRRAAMVWALTVVASFAWALPAHAHVQPGQAAGLLAGLGHPVSGLDHVLAMVAVGLWGAQRGAPALWLLPVAFPMVMALGGVVGLLGLPLPGIEVGIAVILVAFFGVFHGHAHGTELPAGQSPLLYSMGFVIATGCLHGVGIVVGLVHHWPWGQRLLRVAGAGVALAGVAFMWRALA